MSETNYSPELTKVIKYMEDILAIEFPAQELTIEYLVASILDSKKCYANEFLEVCLMSANITELRNIYMQTLYNRSQGSIKCSKEYSNELHNVLEKANGERGVLGANKLNSQHVLLALLNPSNDFKTTREAFSNMGIDYDFVINKIVKAAMTDDAKKEEKKQPKQPLPNNPLMKSIPPKSDTNKVIISGSVEFINKYTINLNDLYEKGLMDPLIGRESEISQSIKVLARRNKNNVILLGNGGCGKTSIVNGIVERIIKNEVPPFLQNKEVVMLNPMALVSGTHFRGMFEERVKGLFEELKSSTKHVLFIDDIQNVLKNGSKDRDTDISSWVGDILVNGSVKVIATTTFKDYRNTIESNTQLVRKFQKIIVSPLNKAQTLDILKSNKHLYEKYHKVHYSEEILEKAVILADRYITDKCLPDSAIDIIDLSGAYTCFVTREPQHILDLRKELFYCGEDKQAMLNKGEFEAVEEIEKKENDIKAQISDFERSTETDDSHTFIDITNEHILSSVSDMTNIPLNKLTTDDKAKLKVIEDTLKQSIVGQDEAISDICRAIKRNKVGLGNKSKPIVVSLLLGKSGVGKTLLAKKLAEEMFGSEKNIVRFDMSEYSEKHSVSKLLGASAGYIGYDNGGQLTEAIKHKQHCVLLLDEIEKADASIYNVFLQLFDEGRLTDNTGQEVNFKNVIILMTSNVGAREASDLGKGMGFNSTESENQEAIVRKSLKKTFTPEFLNRIDKIVYFNPLTDDNLKNIVRLEMQHFVDRVHGLDYQFTYDESVIDFIHEKCVKDKELGARPIIRLIQENVEDELTTLLLENDYENGYTFSASVIEDKISIS